MKKLQYIQPEVKARTFDFQTMMLPSSPGVSGGYEPGMPSGAPKRREGTRAVF